MPYREPVTSVRTQPREIRVWSSAYIELRGTPSSSASSWSRAGRSPRACEEFQQLDRAGPAHFTSRTPPVL
ncbi:hypothetical protein SVIOM74S_01465 [Streptomyces violarus]